MAKVMVIGLDGATFDIIKPLMEKGKLPNFKRMIEQGTHGQMRCTIPPGTVPGWNVFMTGKNPGKIGLYIHVKRDFKNQKFKPLNFIDQKGKCIWDYLSYEGTKTGMLNMPFTYPVQPVKNGFIVSGINTPRNTNKRNFTYPESLIDEIDSICKGYPIDIDITNPHKRFGISKDEFTNRVFSATEKRRVTCDYLLGNKNPDFFIVVFTGSDRLQHFFWHYMDENHPMFEPNTKFKQTIENYYIYIDTILSHFVKKYSNSNFFIVSDHGFEPKYYNFNISNWLKKERYLFVREEGKPSIKIEKSKILDLLRYLKIKSIVEKITPKFIAERIPSTDIFSMIDLKRTRAYPFPSGIIYTKNTEVQKEIIDKLEKEINPYTDEKVFEKVYYGDDLYRGDYTDDRPGLVLVPNQKVDLKIRLDENELLSKKKLPESSASHAIDGIFVAFGPDIKEDHEIKGVTIEDLAPTILHIYGLPIPKNMDGRVLKEIFKPRSDPAEREVKYVDSSYYEESEEKKQIRHKIVELRKGSKI